ncbi:MAG: C25 family cysteine peptidase, partial [Candidatus Krumholzibacteria bacterium]|nr:C25 family cysteine peptidase [Candidatus Krumholzibacteria bacterium]
MVCTRHYRRMALVTLLIGLILVASAPIVVAERLSFSLALPVEKVLVTGRVGHSSVSVDVAGYDIMRDQGLPALPYRVVNILLPQGEQVGSYEFVPGDEVTIRRGVEFRLASPMIAEDGRLGRDPQMAGGIDNSRVYPQVHGRYLGTGYLHGRAVASFAVFPLRAKGGDLRLTETIHLNVATEPLAPRRDVVLRERFRPQFGDRVNKTLSQLVINPEMSRHYVFDTAQRVEQRGGFQPTAYPSLEGSPVDYVIITTDELVDEYQVLADWKTSKGVPTVVRTVQWIAANTRNGADLAETIRFFIRDAYSKWGITYVLLGGDTDILPARYGLSRYYPSGGQTEIPVDLYYSCLDGSWNDTHDEFWGENPTDSPDLYAEVYHGRLPISDPSQVATMVDRITRYEAAENRGYFDKYLFLAEVLFPEDWSEGETITLNGSAYAEFIYFSSLQSTSMDITRMYQTPGPYPGSVQESKAAALDSLNAGFNHVCHIGHGFRFNASVGDLSIRNVDADTLSNDGEWCNLYMLNCTAAAFDFFCLAEHLLQNPNGGAVSAIGAANSAFVNASDTYMFEYYDLLFADDVVHIGETFARSRLHRTPTAVGGDNADLWTHYIYAILAEPEMPLFTGPVDMLTVSHVTSVGLGESNLLFHASAGGLPLDSAVVCLSKGDDDYKIAVTDVSGNVTVGFTAESPGSISVVVTGLNVARHQSYITVQPAAAAYMNVFGLTIDDDAVGGTIGNADGLADAGETVDVTVELVNTGGTAAGGVSLTLSSTHPSVSIVDNTSQFGTVDPGQTTLASDPVRVTFGSEISDESAVEFVVAIQDTGSSTWSDVFRKIVHAPVIDATTLRIDDGAPLGDGDGIVGEGEEFRLFYEIKNYGTGTASGLTAAIEDVSGAFVFVDSVDSYPDVGPFTAAENASGFRMMEIDTTNENSLRVVLTDNVGRVYQDTLELRPPSPPGAMSFDASLGPDRLHVTWTKSQSSDVMRYNVYHSLSSGGPFQRANVDPVDHAVFLDSGLSPLTQYYYYVASIDSSRNESVASAVFSGSTGPPILAGFPILLPSPTASSPAVGDIDGDGDPEIVIGSKFVAAWHHDGTELRDGDLDPRSLGMINAEGDEFASAIALAHMDGAPGLDIVATDLFTNSAYVMNFSGDLLSGWPQTAENGFRAAPVAGDLDGDGVLEVIAVDTRGVVYAWNRDGTEFIDGDSMPATTGVFYRTPITSTHYMTPAVLDIDGDLQDEIIIGSRLDSVYALNGDGSMVAGWPFVMPGEMVGGIVAGDIDGDIHPEIVVRAATSEVYVLDHDGSVHDGWPRLIPYEIAFFRPTPALADVDGDGNLDVVVAQHTGSPKQSKIYVIDHQGNDLTDGPFC